MVNIKKLYESTAMGLNIVKDLYPQAEEGKMFRIRTGSDSCPSCRLHKRKINIKGEQVEVWGITDFGDEGWQNPIDLYMYEKNISQERFYEALQELAQKYNVCENVDAKRNLPRIEKRPALTEEKNGTRTWCVKEQATAAEMAVMGRTVKQETLEALGWKSLNWISNTKEGQTTIKHSTDNYPIFLRECVVKDTDNNGPAEKFYKIYEPLNAEKNHRFQVYPSGGKPKDYVNGIYELRQEYQQYNDKKREEFEANEKNKDKKYQEVKLPCVAICSGERDALACRSMGVPPIWLNSETARLEESTLNLTLEYANVIYNIPDIDDTGIREGKKLALTFLDIKTVWLPNGLRKFRDHRGKPRKDLNDWIDLHPKRDEFYALLKGAKTAKFWVKNDKGLTLDTANLHYFLHLNGFSTYEYDESQEDTELIKVDGYEVTKVYPKTIRKFLRRWVSQNLNDHEVMNLVLNSTKISISGFEGMDDKKLDFTNHTPTSQTFFFSNVAVVVTGDEIKPIKREDYNTKSFVWSDSVIKHNFRIVNEDFFSVTKDIDDTGRTTFKVHINKVDSQLMGYFINSSRIHWRKEMENRFENPTEREAYAVAHKFDLEGEGLTDEEKTDHLQNFLNKVFVAGYMLHGYKDPSRAWAAYAMDNKIGEEGQRNGGSGKSIFFGALSHLMPTVTISGKDPKIFENSHTFERVNRKTRMVVVEDCAKSLDIENFYVLINGEFHVNPKNKTIFSIPFTESPKMAFSTNYVPLAFDGSSVRRMLYMVFGDYYHQQTDENDYLETRKLSDDFGQNILPPYSSQEQWNADINFLQQCERTYLYLIQHNAMIVPPMQNILIRKNMTVMGDNFQEWASQYFAEDSGRLDREIEKGRVYDDCTIQANIPKLTPHTFTKKLKAFVAVADWIDELDPKDMCGKDGRIKRDGKQYIYLRSKVPPF